MEVSVGVGHQVQGSSDLHNLTFLHHTDPESQQLSDTALPCPGLVQPVAGEDGVQPVSDGDHGAVGELALYQARHLLVRHHVHGGGRFVQDQEC